MMTKLEVNALQATPTAKIKTEAKYSRFVGTRRIKNGVANTMMPITSE